MMFKNATIFTLAKMPTEVAGLDKATAECALKPIGPNEISCRGFIPSIYSEQPVDGLPFWGEDYILLTLGGEDRVLPAGAVQRAVGAKIREVEEKEGRKIGGRARKAIKDDVLFEMIPKALVQGYRLDGYIDLQLGIVVVNTASRKQAEGFITEIRHALGTFPALPVNCEKSPRAVMTDLLVSNPLAVRAQGFDLSDEVELRDPVEGGAVAKLSHQELFGDEVRHHLEAGKQVARIGLVHNEHVSFTLDEDLVLRKLRFLDGAVDGLPETDNAEQEFAAKLHLMVAEMRLVYGTLQRVFSITQQEA